MKFIYLIIGVTSFALGIIGALLPILPTVPFLLLSAIMFGKADPRLHNWFVNTPFYEKHIKATYLQKQKLSVVSKFKIMLLVTVSVLLGCIAASQSTISKIILTLVWFGHFIYFCVLK